MTKKIKIPKIKTSLKMVGCKTDELYQIGNSKDCIPIFRQLWDNDTFMMKETMMMILLNRANKVIGYHVLSDGGVSGTVCDPKIVFHTAVTACSSSLILAHNHPSGNLNPSLADKQLTRKIKECAELFDMKLLDHIILTDTNYYSFADEGDI